MSSAAGSVGQVRECAGKLMRIAKSRGITFFIVGHVTKEGALAGPKVLEHIMDTVLYFEGEREESFKILRAVKNRFGSVQEVGVFEMTGEGLFGVTDYSGIFLSESRGSRRKRGHPLGNGQPLHDGRDPERCSQRPPTGLPRRMPLGVDNNK